MKNPISLFVLTAGLAVAALTGCVDHAQQVKNAQANVNAANADLAQANQEYMTDIATYRLETANRIAANEQAIDAYKQQMKHQKHAIKAEYRAKIEALEQKNESLKLKMGEYREEGKEKWEIFKADFSQEMDELGQSIKNARLD